MNDKKVFITGCAGFIGFHMAQALSKQGNTVIGLDNFNDYYSLKLKKYRADLLRKEGIKVIEGDICNEELLELTVQSFKPTHLLHLAAQAGVRYSLTNPLSYIRSNIEGFTHILELIRNHPFIKLCYASSSSVYGLNGKIPYSIDDLTDNQASLYGMTKKANELMATTYSHLYGIKAVGLRFFTVYGPFGRPDMALYSFTKAILKDQPIEIFNFGNMQRDFTYIDDIVAGTLAAMDFDGKEQLFNLGNHKPVSLLTFVGVLEKALGKKADIRLLPMQPGEIPSTYADIGKSQELLGFVPKTTIEEGIPLFVDWYREYSLKEEEDCERGDLNPYEVSFTTTSR